VHPPQQARSRASLQKILAAAELVLAADGTDDFTMATVAERAGVSVGAVYRRFTGKEQLLAAVKDRLLNQLESEIAEALAASQARLADVIDAFTKALVEGLSAGSQVFPALLSPDRSTEASIRGRQALATVQRLFLDAAARHIAEVRRSNPMTALVMAERTITGACIHRVVVVPQLPDGVSWPQWAEQVADMAIRYLTSPDRTGRRTGAAAPR
jgi:AcrR family transcriptional regulator